MDKYAIYLRKSRADVEAEKLGEGETLKRHKEILTNLAAKKELYVEAVYSEIVSGETIAARPQIQKMIADCYEGKYRGIIVVDVDRLSRGNQADMQTIMDCLKYSNNRQGLLVVTPTKTYDVAHNSDDEEYMEFVLFMSRREYKTIQKRLERGRLQAVVEGNYMGSYRPYGYDILKTRTGRTLVPNKEEAPIVKQIFLWTTHDGLTAGETARRLDAMGISTYTGAAEWSPSTIKTILTNPTYIGKVRWNDRMCIKSMVDGKIVSRRPRAHTEKYMLYDGKHPALIDEDTFRQASSRFHSDRTKAGLKLANPLAGLLVCQRCGKALAFQTYNHRKNVSSRYTHPSSAICKVKSAAAQDVIDALVHALKLYITDFEVKINNTPDVDENSIVAQMESLQSELKKSKKKLSKLFDAWEDGIITDNEFTRRKQVNRDRIEKIEHQMEELENSIPEREDYQEKIMRLSDALNSLLDSSLDADVKNEYLKSIINKIEFSRENRDEFILDVYLQ